MNDFKKYLIPVLLLFVITILIGLIFNKSFNTSTSEKTSEKMVSTDAQDMTDKPITHSNKDYAVEITSDTNNIKPGVQKRITFKITEDNATLKNFQVVHEKLLHLIVVRKDLQDFQHIHPTFDSATGEFTIDAIFSMAGPYILYADFTPATFEDNSNNAATVAQTTIQIGTEKAYNAQQVQTNQSNIVKKDDYEVTYTIDPPRSKEQTYILSLKKADQQVKDLQPYLGAMAHSVLLNTKTLQYIHTHADMNSKGPNLLFSTEKLEPGQYKVFTQFQHQDKVQMSEYVFEVK